MSSPEDPPLTEYQQTVQDFIALLQALRAWRKVINLYYQGRLIGRATVNFAGLMQKSSSPKITLVDHFDDDPNAAIWRKANTPPAPAAPVAAAPTPAEAYAEPPPLAPPRIVHRAFPPDPAKPSQPIDLAALYGTPWDFSDPEGPFLGAVSPERVNAGLAALTGPLPPIKLWHPNFADLFEPPLLPEALLTPEILGPALDALVSGEEAAPVPASPNGGRNNVTPLAHAILNPFVGIPGNGENSGIPTQAGYVIERNWIYTQLDTGLNSPGSVYHTNFFNAASNVTAFLGLTGAQFLSTLSGTPYDSGTLADIRSLGVSLYQYVNIPLAKALYNGNDGFVLQSGITLGSAASGSIRELDFALVHSEQTYVQKFLEGLPDAQRASLISESNSTLAGHFVPAIIESVKKNLGHPFDFANQNDREAIGRAEVKMR